MKTENRTIMPKIKHQSADRDIKKEIFKIKEVGIRKISPLKLKRPFFDATMGPFSDYTPCFVRITDKDGFYGECEFPMNTLGLLKNTLAPILFESSNTTTYDQLYSKLFWSIRNEGFRGAAAMALGHLDRIFYDLAARRAEMPLFRYLGCKNPKVRAYASGGGINRNGQELIEDCIAWQEEGYQIIKIKFGGLDTTLKQDVERIMSVREALKPEVKLAIDANQSMTLKKATDLVKLLKAEDIAWLEEPIHSASLLEIEKLCSLSKIKIAYGESERSAKVFPAIIKAGVGHLQPIVGHISSMEDWLNIACSASENELNLSSGGTSQINASFVAAAGENALLEYLEPVVGVLGEILSKSPKIENGHFLLYEEPGIGVEVDWKRLVNQKMVDEKVKWSN